MQNRNPYVGYEYKEITAPNDKVSVLLDGYESFGWQVDENLPTAPGAYMTTLHLKRDRKILNKMELTRLQRHYEACLSEIEALERSKTSGAMAASLSVGIIGTAFMAGSVFAVTHQPPMVVLCIVLAIPAFAGWIAALPLYRRVFAQKCAKVRPLIEKKYDEIDEICEKGHSLL